MKTFIHRYKYSRSRFKFIEFLGSRYWIFWDRKTNLYEVYKAISLEAQEALAKVYKVEETISEWLVHIKSYPSYGPWCLSQLVHGDASRGGMVATDRIIRDFLVEEDEDREWNDYVRQLKELQYHLDSEFQTYVERGKTSVFLGNRDKRLHPKMKAKKIRFVGARTGKVLGEYDKEKRTWRKA